MAMYDPNTGKWYEYSSTTDTDGNVVNSLKEVKGQSSDGPHVIDPTGGPHALAAKILQEQFSEWENVFKPVELNMMNQLSFTNPGVLDANVKEAGKTAESSSEAMMGALARTNKALGISETDQQQAVSNRIVDANKALSVASSENKARQAQSMLDQQILLGSAPNSNIVK